MRSCRKWFVLGSMCLIMSCTLFSQPTNEFRSSSGWPFRDLEMSVESQSAEMDTDVKLTVLIKNVGREPVLLYGVGAAMYNFKMALFSEDGVPVEKSAMLKKLEATGNPDEIDPTLSTYGERILPGNTNRYTLSLRDRFDIEKPGTYCCVVMRQVRDWNDGFLISNLAKIEIVDSETESTESTDTSSE